MPSLQPFLRLCCATFMGAYLAIGSVAAQTGSPNAVDFLQLRSDYQLFYSAQSLKQLGVAFGAGFVAAQSPMDQNFNDWYAREVRSQQSDRLSKVAKNFGEWRYVIPLVAGLSYLPQSDSPAGQWANKSLRATLVGFPAVLGMQVATGASRPNEMKPYDSQWRPFKDNNGVSGHAFMGAVPFLTLAQMNPDNAALYYGATALSLLPAWSRINDRSHYLSQAALGWYVAYHSVQTVQASSEKKSSALQWSPTYDGRSFGLVMYQTLP